MIIFFRKLKWLINNQEKLKKLLETANEEPKKEDKSYSLQGVPDYQLAYVQELLAEKK